MFCAFFAAAIALLSAGCIVFPFLIFVTRQSFVRKTQIERIGNMIADGSKEYLGHQLRAVMLICAVMFATIATFSQVIAVAFAVGFVTTILCGQIAMRVAVFYGKRVVYAACLSTRAGMLEAVRSGTVTSVITSVLSLGVAAFPIYALPKRMLLEWASGTLLGVSSMAILGKVSGGIFTKGADLGADLVGKSEFKLPEDDSRNPAVIADNVGDNVGDCAGMCMDICETRTMLILVTALLGLTDFMCTFRRVLLIGMIASCIGIFTILISRKPIKTSQDVIALFARALLVSALVFPLLLACSLMCRGRGDILNICGLVTCGLIINILVLYVTHFYTDARYSPLKGLIDASSDGSGPNIIEGLAIGMSYSARILLIANLTFVALTLLTGRHSFEAVCIVGATILSQSPLILALDGYGPVIDNAGGISEMSGEKEAETRLRHLDEVGNTMKAITKGYSIFVSLFSAICGWTLLSSIASLHNPILGPFGVMIATIAGCIMVFGMIASTLRAVRTAGKAVAEEVRAQFVQNPKILQGKTDPDYNSTIAFLTHYSLRAMLEPVLAASFGILIPFFIVLSTGGRESAAQLISFLFLSVACVSLFMSAALCISGAAWDNAKKALENTGKKGTPQYDAAITGDIVGDPYKDTTGPALKTLATFTFSLILFLNVLTLTNRTAIVQRKIYPVGISLP